MTTVPVQVRSSAPFVPLAQPDRAFDYESKGQEFESLRARHLTLVMRRCGGTGRRARLKIVRETVGVRVPSPALHKNKKRLLASFCFFRFYPKIRLKGDIIDRRLFLRRAIDNAVAPTARPMIDKVTLRFLRFVTILSQFIITPPCLNLHFHLRIYFVACT